MKIAVLGNVTLDFFAQDFRRAGHEVYLAPGFDSWRQEALDGKSGLHAFAPDAAMLVIDGEGASEGASLLAARLPGARVAAPDVAALARETPGFWDDRMRRLAAMPFSLRAIKSIEDEFFFLVGGSPRKLLALDADNTLWRGIVSEDGAAAVEPYAEFQRGALALRSRGVLLVLLSKNDPPAPGAPVAQAFAREDMPLSLDDFADARVDWSPKAGNLLAACRALNLGVDSAVFIDDNPVERAQMKAHLPEVAVPPFPDDLAHPAQFLRRLDAAYFASVGATDEDRARAAMYRAEGARRGLAAASATIDGYLESLRLVCRAARAAEADVPRLAQMAGKTNQFNATTIRRGEDDMRALVNDPSLRVWTFRARDAFGEMGLVCYVIADPREGRITDFVMSCRAMGRTIEWFALNHVRRELAREGSRLRQIDFAPTAKNGPFREFLSRADLSRAEDWPTHCRSE